MSIKSLKINTNNLRLALPIILVIALTFLAHARSDAQVAVLAGGNFSDIRSHISLENRNPGMGYQVGGSLQYYPLQKLPRISIINEVNYNQKGYQQDFEKDYSFRFSYLSFPVLMDYSLSDAISLQAGVELSSLVSTNVEQGMRTYNHFDTGIVLGIQCFGNKRMGCYSRFTYGLLPVLDYYEIDDLGNFKNEIHDLKNICFSIGMKWNLYHEKIRLYK